jgi:hypothetical protein
VIVLRPLGILQQLKRLAIARTSASVTCILSKSVLTIFATFNGRLLGWLALAGSLPLR